MDSIHKISALGTGPSMELHVNKNLHHHVISAIRWQISPMSMAKLKQRQAIGHMELMQLAFAQYPTIIATS